MVWLLFAKFYPLIVDSSESLPDPNGLLSIKVSPYAIMRVYSLVSSIIEKSSGCY